MKDDSTPRSSPDRLLDFLIGELKLKNDAALCRVLKIPPPVISKIRHQKLSIGAGMLIRMHEVTGISIYGLKSIMAAENPSDIPGDLFEHQRLAETAGRMREALELQNAIESGKLKTLEEVHQEVASRSSAIRSCLNATGVCVPS